MSEHLEFDWLYTLNGEKVGPVSGSKVLDLINEGAIGRKTSLWRKGLTKWITAGESPFAAEFAMEPPPMVGDDISNTIIWWLALAPVIGTLLEGFICGALGLEFGTLWFTTLILNIVLSIMDEKKLKKAGHDVSKMGIAWLVPVYLYKRSEVLQHNKTYFITWCICFVIMLF